MNPSIAEFRRRRIAKDLKTTTPGMFVHFTVYFHKKDTSYVNDREPETGYFMSFQPESVSPTDTPGVEMREMTAWTGVKVRLNNDQRFNRKTLEKLAAETPSTEAYKAVLAQVLTKNNLVLVEGQ